MDKITLEEQVNKKLSTHQIAIVLGKSQTTIRYWLKKHDLKTQVYLRSNKLNCKSCGKKLINLQRLFCSASCKHKTIEYKKRNYTNQQKRGHGRKIELVNLAGGKCKQCGYDRNYAALQFHHINPNEKEVSLDVGNLRTTSWELCLKEVKKCILLCSNCHVEHHNPNFDRTKKDGGPGGI